jgi:thioesterase domain-containing protein
VTTEDALRSELQSTWVREIPLAAAVGIEIAAIHDGELVVRAPLAPNRNLHGTAFAGSLYSVCVLAGWGAVWLALRRAGLDGLIVATDCRIRYRRAVTDEIVCRCSLASTDAERAAAELVAKGRTKLSLTCIVGDAVRQAVEFQGTYAVRAEGPVKR